MQVDHSDSKIMDMQSNQFNINIALIGHVSVGKTTLLNAILGDKFSEVNKRHTTAGISHFHIFPLLKSNQVQSRVSFQTLVESKPSDFMAPHQTLAEIKQDNIDLRKRNIIQHKHYNITVNEALLKMRPDTSLTIIDVPGLNEAGTQDMYTSYVKESWDTYDCVVVVIDVSQGVNTEEQVKLLKFVNSNVQMKKNIPVIVVCNKVDDVDDEELMELVDEVQSEVDEIFQTKNGHREAWDDILQGVEVAAPFIKCKASSPAFIHMSAENAFLYRSVSSLTLKDFSTKVDQAYIDRIGKVECGYMKWRKMKKDQKFKAIHDLFSDPEEYEERLAMTNYDKLMKVLKYFVGGNENQKYLIGQQIDIEFDRLSKERGFAKSISRIHKCCEMVGKDTSVLRDRFYSLFEECKSYYMRLLEDDPKAVKMMCIPMQELIDYHEYVLKKKNWMATLTRAVENDYVMKEMRDMINDYINVVVNHLTKISDEDTFGSMYDPWFKCCGYWQGGSNAKSTLRNHPDPDKYIDCWEWDAQKQVWQNKHTNDERIGAASTNPANKYLDGWRKLSQRDCSNILSSILLMKYSHHFCDNFGIAIANLSFLSIMTTETMIKMCKHCCVCSKRHNKSFALSCHTPSLIVDNTSDPKHFGHLIFLYCQYLDKIDSKSESQSSFTCEIL